MNTYSSMLKKIQLSLLASLHSSHSIFTQSSASFQNDAYGIYTHIWGLLLGPSEVGGTSFWPIELYKICEYVYIKCFTINMTYTILNSKISRIYFTSKSNLRSALYVPKNIVRIIETNNRIILCTNQINLDTYLWHEACLGFVFWSGFFGFEDPNSNLSIDFYGP